MSNSSLTQTLRVAGASLATLAALVVLLVTLHSHQPLQNWLFFRYASYWLLSISFLGGWAIAGALFLKRALCLELRADELFTLSLPVGIVGYSSLTTAFGLIGLLNIWTATVPLVLLWTLGGLTMRGDLIAMVRCRRDPDSARTRRPLQKIAMAIGTIYLALVYFSILSPNNAGFDARWYHLPLAEQYAIEGRIFRFPEGLIFGAFPQIATLIYTWGFLSPAALFDQVELCAHLEFGLFMWTVASVPTLARRLAPPTIGAHLDTSWASVFLFPGLLLYDSSLNLGADHILAFFSIPVFVALLRVGTAWAPREACLLALTLSGALLTKYTAVLIVAPALVILSGFAMRSWWLHRSPARILPGLVTLVGIGLVVTSQHWLKNWIWYGDPLFPQLRGVLTAHPWVPEAEIPFSLHTATPRYSDSLAKSLWNAGRVSFTYAFEHHDWPDMHGKLPVFGFLATLSLLPLPFLGKQPRLWAVFFAIQLGTIFFSFSPQDRYLQPLVPWMAAAVSVSLGLLFKLHLATRVLGAFLVSVQLVWGSDIYFFTTHRMLTSPVFASIELVNSTRKQNYEGRFDVFSEHRKAGVSTPPNSVILAHEYAPTLGLLRRRVSDRPGAQGALYYSRLRSNAEVYDKLRGLGVTHVFWTQPEGADTIASDLIFHSFAAESLKHAQAFGRWKLAALPHQSPNDSKLGGRVAYFGCPAHGYAQGLFELKALDYHPSDSSTRRAEPLQRLTVSDDAERLILSAEFLVLERACAPAISPKLLKKFKRIAVRQGQDLSMRIVKP